VLFLGNSGEGKSSIAAALHTQGYRIITDDVAPVTLDQGTAKVAPSFPQIKLSREVAKVLGYDQDQLALLVPKLNKPGYSLNQDFTEALLPIRCIYVLVSGSQLSIKRLKLQEAVMELSHHSRLNSLFDSEKASHLLQCTQLANKCSVYRLQRPRNLALLPELARLVAEHQFIQGQVTR
ncbi:MAG: serine kinase, partial [Moorea sp. SIO3C2]|nr:serine kinase [Moorena sp. SIO3C2]